MAIQISESISLLARADPDTLRQLRKDYPAEKLLLEEGEEAGPEGDAEAERGRVKTAVAITSIKAALAEYHKWFPRLRSRLARAQQAMFAGQVMALVAGASIFTDSTVNFSHSVRIVCGLVALGGSIATLYSVYLQKPLGADGTNLVDLYRRLAEAGAKAQLLNLQLIAWSGTNGIAPDEVIASANETCDTLNKLAPLFIAEDRPLYEAAAYEA